MVIIFFLFLFLVSCNSLRTGRNNDNPERRLWYMQPAEGWVTALPVGNGRLGAMVFGNINMDTIQFNEESLWAGSQKDANNPEALNYLPEIRRLLFEGKNKEAYDLAEKYLLGTPPRIRSYQIFGNIIIEDLNEPKAVSAYKRELSLNRGISNVQYRSGENIYSRKVFASAKDNVIIIHLKKENKKDLSLKIYMEREKDAETFPGEEDHLVMQGQIIDQTDAERGPGGEHMRFASVLKVLDTDGEYEANGNYFEIRNAGEITLALAAFTDYNRDILNFDRSIEPLQLCMKLLGSLPSDNYEEMEKRHIDRHRPVFERMSIDLGDMAMDSIPTDKRLERVKGGVTDNDLMALYFQYGRYLLMGSSGFFFFFLANLQGIWNHHFNAPWDSDFHTNINLQMNYWPAEVCNLPETFNPYVEFFNELKQPGRVTAAKMYDAGGWTMHHVTDPFGFTALNASVKWGMFPMAAAWVCLPVWRHFEFNQDTAYLRNEAWPLMRGATEFILDFLIESPEAYLVTSPSYSPENAFKDPETGGPMQLTYAPTMDIMIIRELFKYNLEALEILGNHTGLRAEIEETLGRLPPIQIGADGTIQEWIHDYEEFEPGHRHISHLLALHPGTVITEETPELFEAAERTIEKRLSHGGAGTGWSRAWTVNFYARLKNGEEAYNHLAKLLQISTLPNLFDTHPPFQIDGNFGGTAGIAEMLVQSHGEEIEILPAIPSSWKDGEVKGIKARGDFILNIAWSDGKLDKVEVFSRAGLPCTIRYQEDVKSFETEVKGVKRLRWDDGGWGMEAT